MALREILVDPLVHKNPVTLQVLGICSALAITNSLNTALVMGVSLTAVLVFSNASISLIRNFIPSSLRIIIQVTIIATGVIVVDQVLRAFAPEVSRTLSVFVSLIVTNCIVLGRAEACAMKNGLGVSFADAVGNGLGYSIVLIAVATVRELTGAGSLLGVQVFTPVSEGGSFYPIGIMLLAPGAFFLIGFIIWGVRTWKPAQVEEPEYRIHAVHRTEVI